MSDCRISKRIAVFALVFLLLSYVGCGKRNLSQRREAFRYAHRWVLDKDLQGVVLNAALTPQPLIADRPAMLKLRIRKSDKKEKFRGRLWYRFAYRRGEAFASQDAKAPLIRPERGVPPRYDDWFEWAEIIEPRIENGETVFSTPVMLTEGKAYVQFRIASTADSPPQELLEWFVYVQRAH